eukprot:m.208451 g.208451  ORF g.208451 m.208451 type:complete len:335 (-) comp22077_c0_seq3:40-1044(-)
MPAQAAFAGAVVFAIVSLVLLSVAFSKPEWTTASVKGLGSLNVGVAQVCVEWEPPLDMHSECDSVYSKDVCGGDESDNLVNACTFIEVSGSMMLVSIVASFIALCTMGCTACCCAAHPTGGASCSAVAQIIALCSGLTAVIVWSHEVQPEVGFKAMEIIDVNTTKGYGYAFALAIVGSVMALVSGLFSCRYARNTTRRAYVYNADGSTTTLLMDNNGNTTVVGTHQSTVVSPHQIGVVRHPSYGTTTTSFPNYGHGQPADFAQPPSYNPQPYQQPPPVAHQPYFQHQGYGQQPAQSFAPPLQQQPQQQQQHFSDEDYLEVLPSAPPDSKEWHES